MGDLTPEQRERLIRAANSAWEGGAQSVSALVNDMEAVVADLLAEQRQGIAAAILTSTEGLSVEAYSTQWITVDDAARIAETYGGAS